MASTTGTSAKRAESAAAAGDDVEVILDDESITAASGSATPAPAASPGAEPGHGHVSGNVDELNEGGQRGKGERRKQGGTEAAKRAKTEPARRTKAAEASPELLAALSSWLPRLCEGEYFLAPSSTSAAFSYYLEIAESVDTKTHACLLCKGRFKLINDDGKLNYQNAKGHLQRCLPGYDGSDALPRFQLPAVKATGPLDKHLSNSNGERRASTQQPVSKALKQLSTTTKRLIEENMMLYCVENLEPYSYVEREAFRMLIDHLLEVGGYEVRLFGRTSYIPLANRWFVTGLFYQSPDPRPAA